MLIRDTTCSSHAEHIVHRSSTFTFIHKYNHTDALWRGHILREEMWHGCSVKYFILERMVLFILLWEQVTVVLLLVLVLEKQKQCKWSAVLSFFHNYIITTYRMYAPFCHFFKFYCRFICFTLWITRTSRTTSLFCLWLVCLLFFSLKIIFTLT